MIDGWGDSPFCLNKDNTFPKLCQGRKNGSFIKKAKNLAIPKKTLLGQKNRSIWALRLQIHHFCVVFKRDGRYIPAKCPGGLLRFYWGWIAKIFHRDRLFFTRVQCKGYYCRSLKMTGMLILWLGIPAGKIFYPGYPRWLIILPGWKPARHLAGIWRSWKLFMSIDDKFNFNRQFALKLGVIKWFV